MLTNKQKVFIRRLNEKAYRIENFDAYSAIKEGRIKYLFEAIDESEITGVRSVVNQLETIVKDLKAKFKELGGADLPQVAAMAAAPVSDYLTALEEVIAEINTGLGTAEFETGILSSFLGEKVTLPQMVSVTSQAIARTQAFLQSFLKFKTKFERAVKPNIDDKTKSVADAIMTNPKLPKIVAIEKFAAEAFKDAAGGGMISKATGFFGNLLKTGAADKALDKFPKADADKLGKGVAQLFAQVPFDKIEAFGKPPEVDTSAAQPAVDDASDADDDVGGDDPPAPTPSGDPPAPTDVKISKTDLAKLLKKYAGTGGQPSQLADRTRGGRRARAKLRRDLIAVLGSDVIEEAKIKKGDLAQLIIKYPDITEKGQKGTKARAKFRKELIAIIGPGLIQERRMLLRWQDLAGLLKD